MLIVSIKNWLAPRRDAYHRVIVALGLNLPLVFLVLARFIEGVHFSSMTSAYAASIFTGYYTILLLLLVSGSFWLLAPWKRTSVAVCAVMIAAVLFYLVVDGMVYRVFRLHVDAFWLQYAITSFSGWGISVKMLGIVAGALALIASAEVLIFRLARRVPNPRRIAILVTIAAFVSYAVSQTIHIIAYETNDQRFTGITSQLPFYYPVTSHSDAVKYAHLLPGISESHAATANARSSFTYPLHNVTLAGNRRLNVVMIVLESWRFDTMNESVSPRMYDFAQRSSVFLDHFSSGNCTPAGIFSLFYGIHPTYWNAVKANAAAIENPVLIDALAANGYAFGIFADSHFQRHKIKDTVFRGIDVDETFAGASADLKDRDLTNQLIAFVDAQTAASKPYFAFAFYKSTHFSYYYPKDSAVFLPASKLNLATASAGRDPTAFFNDYKNSVHYVDQLVGEVLDHLQTTGALTNTVVVITSDHGEEFNDNRANYWGHTSNFTGYQTRVPMIVYVPGQPPRQVHEATAHIDIPPTLMIAALGCGRDISDYSDGCNLFEPIPERPMILTSFVNYAIIMGDDVYSIFPMYVQKYKLWDINAKAGVPRADLTRSAMFEMYRFLQTALTTRPVRKNEAASINH